MKGCWADSSAPLEFPNGGRRPVDAPIEHNRKTLPTMWRGGVRVGAAFLLRHLMSLGSPQCIRRILTLLEQAVGRVAPMQSLKKEFRYR